jgi:hypothetical protein
VKYLPHARYIPQDSHIFLRGFQSFLNSNPDLKNFAGICSDYILELKNNFIES